MFNKTYLLWISRGAIEVDLVFWKILIKEACPFGLALAFVIIFYWADSVILSLLKGYDVVGWYNVSYRMVLALLYLPNAYISALYPIMSNFYLISQRSLRSSFSKSFKHLFILAIPIGLATTLLAKRIILEMFGSGYLESILPLQILVWSAVCIYMSFPFANLFNSLNKQRIVTKIAGVAMILNVVLNIIFIPKYGLVGASVITCLTELVVLGLNIIYGLKIGYSIPGKEFMSIVTKVFTSSILMCVAIVSLYNLRLAFLVPLCIALYFIMLYILRGVDEEILVFLKNKFTRFKI
jgi:O-antigen/teichoic acid export membrane protein